MTHMRFAGGLLAALILCIHGAPWAQMRASPQLGIRAGAVGAAAAPSGPQAADYIVAVVNSEPITQYEVRSRMVRLEQQLAQQGAVLPARDELARQVLERLIVERAQLQMARESGIKVDDTLIDQAELSVAQQNQMDIPGLRRRMAEDGIAVAQFRDELRNQLLLTRLRDREVEPKVKISDLEVDQFIREQQGSSDLSQLELNLAQVLVAVPETATPEQVAALQAKAQRVRERARTGEDFGALVREFSDAPGGAATGGQMGLRSAERYPQLFLDTTRNLRAGDVSPVVRSGAGFHVLKVVERRQGGLPGADVVQSNVRHILLRLGPQMTEQQARARLTELRRRIEGGADFATLARENSQDGSARNGGDLGWANPGLFVPEFENAVNELRPGQMAGPITTRFGVHLIQLQERRTATLTQREQRDIARSVLREKKGEEEYARWAQEVRGRAYVEFRQPPQ